MDNIVKFSVIIPCYNVEKYVDVCIQSVLKQSISDLEVIAVDDGSTDKTAEILDSIAKQDTRLIIVHKNNAGVSAARNSGLEIAKGEYIIFVDADDYLAEDYISYMFEILQKTDSPFAISKNCYTKKNELQISDDKISQISSDDAVALLLSPVVVVGCWNKVYKRSFLIDNNIRFSENLFYGEGLSFIIECAEKAAKIGTGNRKVYFYRKNNGASATTIFNIEKIYNGEKSINTIEKRLQPCCSKISTMLLLHRCMFYAGAVVRMKDGKADRKYDADYKRYLSYIRKNWVKIFFNSQISLYRKLLISGCCISPFLMMKLDNIRRKRNFNNSI